MRRALCPARSAALATLVLLALPAPCFAVGEEERQVALTAGAGRLAGGGVEAAGGALARLEGAYGLTDTLALHAALGGSWHARSGGTVSTLGVVAGVTYALDVLRVVPFFEGGVAFLGQGGPGPGRSDLGLEGGVGGEYLLDRYWALALVARAMVLPLRLSGSGGTPSLLTLALRLGRTF
jgi:hypothetical protein